MVICQETPSHGKNIYGNLTAARHAPSKKVRYTRYYRFLRCAFLSVKQNYGKIRPRRAAVVCLPMSNLFSISKILSVTITKFNGIWYSRYFSHTLSRFWTILILFAQQLRWGCRCSYKATGWQRPGASACFPATTCYIRLFSCGTIISTMKNSHKYSTLW